MQSINYRLCEEAEQHQGVVLFFNRQLQVEQVAELNLGGATAGTLQVCLCGNLVEILDFQSLKRNRKLELTRENNLSHYTLSALHGPTQHGVVGSRWLSQWYLIIWGSTDSLETSWGTSCRVAPSPPFCYTAQNHLYLKEQGIALPVADTLSLLCGSKTPLQHKSTYWALVARVEKSLNHLVSSQIVLSQH